MKLWIDVLLVLAVVLGPPVVTLMSLQYYGPEGVNCGFVLSGVYFMLVVVALVVRRRRQAARDENTLQEIRGADSPPPYEMVAAKPPPYSVLYASAPPTDDVIRFPNSTSRFPMTYVPVHIPRQDIPSHKSPASPPTLGLARQESYDAGLPTYQEAVRYISLATHVPGDSLK
ncbi:uncharacterized protein LOC125043252 [Penaeus chinensis]|uniref:uncharacterized protein LOC125043252 n=1 Tax=Penaeus chinensis TaxID=139456 RepID=UPI001FB6FA06|nr:uncharacterized protein LOC125043252 [Penaeus chinensis]